MELSVVIVGLGAIGMGYDLDSTDTISTHAKAFQAHDDFYLVAGIDCNIEKRNIFEKKYKCKSFSSIDSALSEVQPDIVVIATPTRMHCANVKDVIKKSKPIVILCEKPMSYNLDEAREIVSLCKANNVKLYLNYIRRSDPSVEKIKKMIDTGVMSAPIKGVVWYSKGFLHNGAHFYDLLKFWFGSMVSSKIINNGRRINDFDFEPDVNVSFADASVFFLAANEEFYSHYTIELITPQGRLRYDRGGNQITWHQSVNSSSIVDYKFLSNIGDIINSDMNYYQLNVVKDISNVLNGKDTMLCTADEELQTMIDLHSIIDGLKGVK
jgi:predicted dehydrogenase